MSLKIGLCMIVKDEEAVIERALRSALPFVNTWVIVDTGSTDRTKEIIQAFFDAHSIQGQLHSREWVNFGHNRTEALELCQGQMDWAIMLDADDTLEGKPLPAETFAANANGEVNGFTLQIFFQGHHFRRVQIFKMSAKWRYIHTVHEIAVCDYGAILGHIPVEHTFMQARSEGAQSHDPIGRAERDIRLLLSEPQTTHTLFHLANSYREAKQNEKAIECYWVFVALDCKNNIDPEKYISLVNIIYLSTDTAEQLRACKAAMALAPHRLEAQYNLMHRCRYAPNAQLIDVTELYNIATSVTNRCPDLHDFMVTPAIYDWLFDYELTFIEFNVKHYQLAYDAAVRSLVGCTPVNRDALIELVKFIKKYLPA